MKALYRSFSVCGLFLVAFPARTQEAGPPSINIERPTIGSTTDLTRPGWVIVENGVGFSRDRSSWMVDSTETLLRYGVAPWLELRLAPPNVDLSSTSMRVTPLDGAVSLKVALPSAKRWPLAAIAGSTVPVGRETSGKWDPAVTVTGNHSWTPSVSNGFTYIVFLTSSNEGVRSTSHQFAFDMGYTLSQTATGYVEFVPLRSTDPTKTGFTTDVGISWMRGSFRAWDARFGYNQAGGNGAIGAGFGYSFMLPQRGWAR